MSAPRLLFGAAALATLGVLIPRADNYQLYVLALVGLTTIVGVGLNVLLGLSGQISLGHVAFYAIGAYTVGILTTKTPVGFWAALPLAAAVAGMAGALLALPALRVRGPYLAMVTIAFGFIVEQGAVEWSGLTGGWNGLIGIPTPSLGGHKFAEREIAVFVILLAGLAIFLFARLQAGPWGKAMRAVRDSEIASQSIGLNPTVIRTVAFVISAAVAGFAGGIFAAMSDFISPESFPFSQSILLLLVVMVGGADRIFGPLMGALIVVLLPELLSWLAQYRLLFVGLLLFVVLRLAPDGLVGLVAGLARADRDRLAAARRDVTTMLSGAAGRNTLCVTGVSVGFGGVRALADLSFAAEPGRITSIIGPNGAGKSTVLNLTCGFYRPDGGSIRLGDQEIAKLPSHAIARAGIARTYQTTQLFGRMSAIDNVLVALRAGRPGLGELLTPDSDPERAALAESLLAFVGYAGPLQRLADALAHVDKRLLEIARALAIAPHVLALDEPAAGLDAGDTRRLGEVLRKVAATGIAVLLVEHDMGLVMSVSDHVVVLDAGQKIAEGPPSVVARDALVLRAYLGAQGHAARDRKAPLAAGGALLSSERLSAGYGVLKVIRDVDIAVGMGELVAVLGANGVGKSTLLAALSGLNRPIGGNVIFRGRHIETSSTSRIVGEGLVLVPEGRQVFAELSVMDNIRLGAYARPAGEEEERIEQLLDRFPLLKLRRHQRAGLLSGGEQQMLALARGLMARPTVLMLDEPSLGLAPMLVEKLYDLLAELRDEGTTILLVDQMAGLALSVADRAYVLQSGTIEKKGRASELRADPDVVRAYLGEREGTQGLEIGRRP
jgi:ABC-type branched-subunit amino acid transport system ATPase component/ABC-type branched-subunit amino acid transport system permease subunit